MKERWKHVKATKWTSSNNSVYPCSNTNSFKRQLTPNFNLLTANTIQCISCVECTGIENIKFLIKNKVITTMVIWPLDDPTWCAESVIADLRPLGLRYVWGRGWFPSIARLWVPISSPLTHMAYLLPFSSDLAGSKSVSARLTRIRWQILL